MALGNPNWKAGISGNPTGRPSVSLSLADVIRRRFPPERIVDLAKQLTESADDRVRLGALAMLTDRGYGKVLTTLELTARQPEAAVNWSAVSVERRLEIEEALGEAIAVAVVPEADGVTEH